jgi:hypothetical protein
MAIERGVDDIDIDELDIEDNSKEILISDESEDELMFDDIEDGDESILEDGTMVFGEDDLNADAPIPFTANLAEELDKTDLGRIYSDLMSSINDDKSSRKEWMDQYTEGLKFLGMKFENRTEPFDGASGVIHPLLAESVTQFQAQAYKEMLPPGGPVKTNVIGMGTPQTDLQAARVQEYMNYMITQEMKEYDPETDQLLFYLPLSGSAFRKVHFDQSLGRPVSRFIPSEKLIVPYGTTSLDDAVRITHVIDMSMNEVRKLQQSGFYKKTSMSDSNSQYAENDEVDDEIDELQGVKPSGNSSDYECELFEVHAEIDIPGFEDLNAQGEETGIKLPYIVTISPKHSTILSIRRNYAQADMMRKRIDYFVHYKFLPGVGFYGFGLTHMIGGLSQASTSILRQLIDAGTLANLPAGFKARGIRIRDSDVPLQPGEFRDMDAPGGSLRDALMPLPFKEPSGTLLQLLGMLVEAGRRFASVGDMQVGDGNQQAPVGTTIALLEKGGRVMSAIHKRMHYSQRIEFNLLARVIKDSPVKAYPYQIASGQQQLMAQDFDDRIDIIPVSDPNIFSMSQRVMLAQEMMQMVQTNPQIHGPQGMYEAYRRMYEAMGVQQIEQLLPPPPQPQPVSAAMENSGFLQMQPAQAFPDQDHDAHIKSHLLLLKSPIVAMAPPGQQQALAMIQSHIYQHIDFKAREMAQQDPEVMQMQQQIQQIQQQAQIDPMMQQQVQMQVQQMQQQMQTIMEDKVAQTTVELLNELEEELQIGQEEDPLVDLRREELGLKDKDIDRKAQEAQQRIKLEGDRIDNNVDLGQDRLALQEQTANMKDDVARERIELQRSAQMAKTAENMAKNFFNN